MSTKRKRYVAEVKRYIGAKKGSKKHRHIINVFNKVKPDGEVMTYSAPWCAAFASACAIEEFGAKSAANMFPIDYNCGTIISKAKKRGMWHESNTYRPSPGDWIIFTWSGSQSGADHVGVVVKVSGSTIYTVEGNKSTTSQVGQRTFPIGWRYIRGYVVPKYSTKKVKGTRYKVKAKGGLNVRSGRGTNYRIKRTLANGTIIHVTKIKDGWAYSSDAGGWVSKKYIRKA
jgi:hypothetical protein